MASTKPLRLKRQKVPEQIEIGDEVVDVILDSSVRHLDQPFTYALPRGMSAISRGSYVACLFNGKPHRGIVVNVRQKTSRERSLIPISSLLHELPLITALQWQLIEKVALFYGISRAHAMNFAFASPVKKRHTMNEVETQHTARTENHSRQQKTNVNTTDFYYAGIGENYYERAMEQSRNLARSGPVILIVPDQRDFDRMREMFTSRHIDFHPYTSTMSKSELFSSYHKALLQTPGIYLGTRSAIWLPVVATVIIINELDASYTERHSPFFHCRDIALLRAAVFNTSLHFISVAPSLELSLLVKERKVSLANGASNKFRVSTESESHLAVIRRGISQGPVLIVVGEKGYYNSVICSQCRNHPTCRCGGRLTLSSTREFHCSLCGMSQSTFRCQWCRGEKYLSYRKGSERIAMEIGKAFPHAALKISTRDVPIDIINENCIVIATLGMSPQAQSGYSAIVFLDCEMILNRPLLRSEEFARLHWRTALSNIREGGEVYFSLPNNHREVQSIIRRDGFVAIDRELDERAKLSLPPHREMTIVTSATRSISQIGRGLKDEFGDSISINHDERNGEYRLIIRAKRDVMSAVIGALADVQRLRSARKQSPLTVIRNPIDL